LSLIEFLAKTLHLFTSFAYRNVPGGIYLIRRV
jgi:hypothetical protein